MSVIASARRAWPLAVLLFACACGSESTTDSPTTPSDTTPPPSGVASIAGSWNATSDFQQNGTRYISNMTATLTQNDRTVEGTFRFTSAGWQDWNGRISGVLVGNQGETQFAGTVLVESNSFTGTGICTGQMSLQGRVTSSSMRWEGPSFTMRSNVASQPASACRGELFTPVWIFFR